MQAWFAIGMFVLGGLFLSVTPWGRYVYAIGINRQAAFLSALPVRALPFFLYIAHGRRRRPGRDDARRPAQRRVARRPGADVRAAGAHRRSSSAASPGPAGAVALSGVFLALVFLAVLENGLTLLNVSPFVQLVVRGSALIVAAGLDALSGRLAGRLRFRARTTAQRTPPSHPSS